MERWALESVGSDGTLGAGERQARGRGDTVGSGAEILVKALEREQVEVIFCYPGGANLEILDQLRDSSIRMVLTRHEQGAAHEASGYGRVSGRPGVCLATSGPGATNLVTGLAAASMDSVPLIAITGQVGTGMVGTDAFQEVDVTGITDPITKHNYLVRHPEDVAKTVKEAFYIAGSGRPGPVLLDIPRDVAQAETGVTTAGEIDLRGYKPNLRGHQGQIKQVLRLLADAARPVVIAGGGVLCAGAWPEMLRLAEGQRLPIANTLMGLGSVPLDHALALGMMGVHGLAPANLAVQSADLLIALGTRFSDRMSCNTEGFAPAAKIIHIDVDPAEIGKNVRADVPLVGDLKIVLGQILAKLEPGRPAGGAAGRDSWLAEIAEWKKIPHDPGPVRPDRLSAPAVIEALAAALPPQAIVATDVGQHQMWAAQRLRHRRPRGFISSGGLGAMGYGIPAAIGAQLACPRDLVVVVTGDGSFQMGLPELGTAKERRLPVKILLLNNDYLGMVKQLQDFYCDHRYAAVAFSDNPDFGALAAAYGADYFLAADQAALSLALPAFLAAPGLAVLEARVAPEENVYPMVLAGQNLDQMIGR
ncbi:MAG: biosynthetic-type acetolactate synthase large subunit [Peptococcaceae bacterium]|jgi:acetolactate synthase-1/2/3 large subunit|nr:biosynthetic-type acetolactate synthase large subunit [Peptococcaceae bacterium]